MVGGTVCTGLLWLHSGTSRLRRIYQLVTDLRARKDDEMQEAKEQKIGRYWQAQESIA
jgi:hypothetical protein